MTVHQDYEIKINLNELIEKRIPCCDLLHPDHCLTEQQVSEIAHDIRMDLNLHDLYKQVDQHIMNYVNSAGIDNKDHWVEPHLSLIHISEPTRPLYISYAVFCLMVMNHEIIIYTPIFAVLIGFIVFTISKKRKRSAKSIYKLIDDLEKKYIY